MVQFAPTARQRILIIALCVAVAIIVIALGVHFGNKSSEVSPVDVSGIDKVRINPEYAFDVNDNLVFCNRKAVNIKLLKETEDYVQQINKELVSLSRGGGGTVVLDEGIYPVSAQIQMPSKACLRGQGMLKTMLRMKPQSPPYEGAGMIRVKDSSRISILDLTLDGARDTQLNATKEDVYGRYGLYAEKFQYLWLRGVRAINHREYGFDPHGTREAWSHYLVIQGSVADNNGKDGFTLDQTEHISLLDSAARRNARHGVNIVTGSRNVLVRRVSAEFNGAEKNDSVGCGIIVQNNEDKVQTKDIIIDNSMVSESPRGGVCISESVNVTLSNVNATVTRFERTPCFVLRQARQVEFKNTRCTARSGRRTSNIESIYIDDSPNLMTRWLPQSSHVESPWANDMYCRKGIQYKDVCCSVICEHKCGVAGCGENKMASQCCRHAIHQENRTCTKTMAPCVMDVKYLAVPHVYIDAPVALKPGDTVASPSPPASVVLSEKNSTDPNSVAVPVPDNMTTAKPVRNETRQVAQGPGEMQVVAIPGNITNGTTQTNLPSAQPIPFSTNDTVVPTKPAVIVEAPKKDRSSNATKVKPVVDGGKRNETVLIVDVSSGQENVTMKPDVILEVPKKDVELSMEKAKPVADGVKTNETELIVDVSGTKKNVSVKPVVLDDEKAAKEALKSNAEKTRRVVDGAKTNEIEQMVELSNAKKNVSTPVVLGGEKAAVVIEAAKEALKSMAQKTKSVVDGVKTNETEQIKELFNATKNVSMTPVVLDNEEAAVVIEAPKEAMKSNAEKSKLVVDGVKNNGTEVIVDAPDVTRNVTIFTKAKAVKDVANSNRTQATRTVILNMPETKKKSMSNGMKTKGKDENDSDDEKPDLIIKAETDLIVKEDKKEDVVIVGEPGEKRGVDKDNGKSETKPHIIINSNGGSKSTTNETKGGNDVEELKIDIVGNVDKDEKRQVAKEPLDVVVHATMKVTPSPSASTSTEESSMIVRNMSPTAKASK